MVEEDFINEKKSAVREFEDQKVYLRDHLITELEEKLKQIETERHNMELTGDSFEMKPISTRKLRRRANEPSGSYLWLFIIAVVRTGSCGLVVEQREWFQGSRVYTLFPLL